MRRSFALTILLNNTLRPRHKMTANAAPCLEANTGVLGDNAQTLLRGSSDPILGNVNDLLKTKVDAGPGCSLDVSTCTLKGVSGKDDCAGTESTTYQDLSVDTTTGTISFDPNGVAGSVVEYCLACKDTLNE
jgi:hypothetical protein